MKLVNSVCIESFLPGIRKSIGYFHEMARFLSGKGIDLLNFITMAPSVGKWAAFFPTPGLKVCILR